jgi:hypothetical protein
MMLMSLLRDLRFTRIFDFLMLGIWSGILKVVLAKSTAVGILSVHNWRRLSGVDDRVVFCELGRPEAVTGLLSLSTECDRMTFFSKGVSLACDKSPCVFPEKFF